jgi:predicted secreted protein
MLLTRSKRMKHPNPGEVWSKLIARLLQWLCLCAILLAGCSTPTLPPAVPLSPTPPSATPRSVRPLTISLLYPKADTEAEMGQPVKFIVRVTDAEGQDTDGAQVALELRDAHGQNVATVPAMMGRDKVYRSAAVPIPHRTAEGRWQIAIEAAAAGAQGSGSGNFQIKDSTSEILLNKYGFWLDAPTLRGIVPQQAAERGDAQNGMIRWGGVIPAQHVLPENWIELHWKKGNYRLDNPAAVRQFLLKDVGDLGVTPVREIDPFQATRFKHWDAWQAMARGQVEAIQMEWLVFYAPEVDRTYALATTVVLPPAGIDPHATLRASFDLVPDIHATGIALEPLLTKQWPGPELLSPPLGAVFQGVDQPIVLQWQPLKELAPDEYFEVYVDYNYKEGNPRARFTTRETQLTLPETLYQMPNCGVFNWQVTLKRQTGVDQDGQPQGESISYNSLYWYVRWGYPPGQAPFALLCPNEQF